MERFVERVRKKRASMNNNNKNIHWLRAKREEGIKI